MLNSCIVCNRVEWHNESNDIDVINHVDSILPTIILFRDYNVHYIPPVFIVEGKKTKNYGVELQFTTRRLDNLILDSVYYRLKSENDSLIKTKNIIINKTFLKNSCDSLYQATGTRNCDKRIWLNSDYDIKVEDKSHNLKIDLQLFLRTSDNKPVIINYINQKLTRLSCHGIFLFPF